MSPKHITIRIIAGRTINAYAKKSALFYASIQPPLTCHLISSSPSLHIVLTLKHMPNLDPDASRDSYSSLPLTINVNSSMKPFFFFFLNHKAWRKEGMMTVLCEIKNWTLSSPYLTSDLFSCWSNLFSEHLTQPKSEYASYSLSNLCFI